MYQIHGSIPSIMAMRQTDSESPVAENAAESTLESPEESIAESPEESVESANVTGYAAALRTEQTYVTMLYGLLDAARERSEQELSAVRARGGFGGTHQARLERDVSAAEQERRLAQLNLTERGLCFGRFDDESRQTLYIGRIGLRNDDYELKLIDWRAPAARPFYAATPRNPVGLIRRRHIYTRLRKVTGVDDEVFDLDRLSDSDKATLSGEAALIAAVSAARTGRMADVVATIQAERTGSSARSCPACWSSRAVPAPARRSPPCTAPPTCSTPTAAPSTAAACW